MKNLKVYIVAAMIIMSVIPVSLKADTGINVKNTGPKSIDEVRAQILINRLEEIDAMDKSDMNHSEKKELRREIRTINKELKEVGGGVYLSVGAVIVIVLLLILLL